MEDWNPKKKPNLIESLVKRVKSFAEGYSQEAISKVSNNVIKCATLRLEVTLFSTYCRIPVFVLQVFRLIYVKKN